MLFQTSIFYGYSLLLSMCNHFYSILDLVITNKQTRCLKIVFKQKVNFSPLRTYKGNFNAIFWENECGNPQISLYFLKVHILSFWKQLKMRILNHKWKLTFFGAKGSFTFNSDNLSNCMFTCLQILVNWLFMEESY